MRRLCDGRCETRVVRKVDGKTRADVRRRVDAVDAESRIIFQTMAVPLLAAPFNLGYGADSNPVIREGNKVE